MTLRSLPAVPVETNLRLRTPIKDGLIPASLLILLASVSRLRLQLLVSHQPEVSVRQADDGDLIVDVLWTGEAQTMAAREAAETLLRQDIVRVSGGRFSGESEPA
jgi:2-phospho-L-lactate transferase/gluconeogenesis factor (CofD/UPF0052 family)